MQSGGCLARVKLNVCCLVSDPDLSFPLSSMAEVLRHGHKTHVTHMTMKQLKVLIVIKKKSQTKHRRSFEKRVPLAWEWRAGQVI